jgi:excinuclease UvrABC ATPase subunit
MDKNYMGNTNSKSAFTKHLFADFRKAYFHFKPRLEASIQGHEFYFAIEGAFPYICEGEGKPHINNDDIKQLYERCNQMLGAIQLMELDDSDNVMVDVVVKTGSYLAIVLDLTAQEARLRDLEGFHASKRSKMDGSKALLTRINAL